MHFRSSLKRFFAISLLAVFLLPLCPQYVFAAAPSAVSNVVPVPANGQVTLTWTNPASVDFTGTLVRYSTSSFPATVSDGTLGGDIAGAVSGTSSVTISGLINGKVYYFSLFAHNSVPEYAAAVNTQQLVMQASFTEDFESLVPGDANGQNGWAKVAGTWTILDTSGEQTLKSGVENLTFDQYRILNGGNVSAYANQMVRADWRGTTINAPGQLFLRTQSLSADAGGYVLTHSGGLLRISYKSSTGSTFTSMATGAFTQVANTWYTYEFSIINGSSGVPTLNAYVWARGSAKPSTPTVTATDTINRFVEGGFSVGKSATTAAEYDNVTFYAMPADTSAFAFPGDGANTLSWTNSTASIYAGTQVRVSTSSYPELPTDGSLVATVPGSSGATSTATHSGLTNGTKYYYTLFPYDNGGAYGTPLFLSQVAYPELLSEPFTNLSTGSVVAQHGWGIEGGTWTVTDVSSNRLLWANSAVSYLTDMAVNGNEDSLNQVLSYRFQSDTASNTAGYSWLRRQKNNDGYLVWHNGNVWTISYQSGATFTNLATASTTVAPAMAANTWFYVETSIINNESDLPVISVYVWKSGSEKPATPTLTYTDVTNRFAYGTFALSRSVGAASAYFDDVHFAASLPADPASPTLLITSPAADVVAEPDTATLEITDEFGSFYIPYIQTSTTLTATATLDNVPVGGGIRFVLNEGLADEVTVDDLAGPSYSASFPDLEKKEYTLDAYEILGDGVTLSSDPDFHDYREHIAIGDIITVLGDSTSSGVAGTDTVTPVTNWLEADAESLSLDHRNFPQNDATGTTFYESFLSDLNDKLSAYYGYPVFFMNEAQSGYRASNYETGVMISNWTARQLALAPTMWFVDLGNGDSQVSHDAATYRASMESLISRLETSYGAVASGVYVPYPFYDDRDSVPVYLSTYPAEIDDMRTDLGLGGGPDLYYTFSYYKPAEYTSFHPSATGYEHIARLWMMALMRPAPSTAVSGRQITLSWDDLHSFESSLGGYTVRYGTSSDNLNTTVTTGSSTTSLTLSNLPWNTTYYFTVQGFDNDPYQVSYTKTSSTLSASTPNDVSAITVSAASGYTNESGGTSEFSVVLANRPFGDVTFPVTSSNTAEGTVSVSSLTFNDTTWNIPQVISVHGIDDAMIDGDVAYTITLGAATSADITYNGINPSDISMVNTDNDLVALSDSVPMSRPERPSSTSSENTSIGESQSEADIQAEIQAIEARVAALPLDAPVHGLVKLADDGDPLTWSDSTVYYVGADGLRHSFVNESVFRSWFCDFSGVRTISEEEMSSLLMGLNVTYRPGTKLVKFVTDPRVYAVDVGGVLRWISDEHLASDLYGDLWFTMIDDVSDVYFGNYVFGSPIASVSEYDRLVAEESARYPSATFAIPGYEQETGGASCIGAFTTTWEDVRSALHL